MNLIILHGRLTADPEVRFTTSQKKVASYTIAVQAYNGNANFINCQCWGKSADFVEQYLQKGKEIVVRGRLEPKKFNSKGVTHYSYIVEVESHEFCGRKETPTATDNLPDGFNNIPNGVEDDGLPLN